MESEEQYLERHHHKNPDDAKKQFHSTRQWLNIIFMVGAVAGVLVYLFHTPQTLGIIIILIAMVFKIIECALRFIK